VRSPVKAVRLRGNVHNESGQNRLVEYSPANGGGSSESARSSGKTMNVKGFFAELKLRNELLQTVDDFLRQSLRFVELALFVVASADTDTDKNILL